MSEELQTLSSEKLSELDRVLDELRGPIPVEELQEMMDLTEKGIVAGTRKNCVLAFRHDPELYGKFRYNILAQRVYVIGSLPWDRQDKGNALANSDLRAMHLYLEATYGIKSAPMMDEALDLVADENQYHPVRDYLNSLPPWDGEPRVRNALHHFLGADASDYTYELLKFFMLGAIARAFNPGVKFDYMLCLVGGQGVGKSSFFRFLCTNDEWFCDDLRSLEASDVYERLQGHWIIEMSEMMAAINAKTNEAIKSFLSRQKETYRTRYDKLAEDRPRQCVFAGTTNKMFFLPNDRTGNRRFLPIICQEGEAEVHILDDEKASRVYFDQMWAEVMEIWNHGNVRLRLPKELEAEIREHQQMFVAEDVDAGLIYDFMISYQGDKVCSKQLFKEALHNEFTQPQRWQTNEICEIMNQLISTGRLTGWRYFSSPKRFINTPYGTQRGWEKIPEPVQPTVNEEACNRQMTLMEAFEDLPPDADCPFDTG